MSPVFDGDFRKLLYFLWDHKDVAIEAVKLVQQIANADEPVNTPAGIKERLTPALQLAKLGASLTATTKDDEAVVALQHLLLNDDIISGIASLIDLLKHTDHDNVLSALASGSLAEEARARGINWSRVLEILKEVLPYLLPLILSESTDEEAGQ